MLLFIYTSGWLYFLYSARTISSDKRFTINEKLLLVIVSLVPLGKLVYFNLPLLGGLKPAFVMLNISLALIALLGPASNNNLKLTKSSLSLMWFFIPAMFSLLLLKTPEMLLFYQVNDEQSDSALFRVFSFFGLLLFAAWIADFVKNHGLEMLAEIFCKSLIFATLVGFVIYLGVMQGKIGEEELNPISAGVHVAEGFYRFNPGANVNEFGVIVAYGIFFVYWLPWSALKKALYLIPFFAAEFLSLTRGAWVALMIGVLAQLVFAFRGNRTERKYAVWILVWIAIVGIGLAVTAYLSADLAYLLESRTTLQGGASGDERIEKFQSAYDEIVSSPIRILFGFGWSSNLYAHSLPVQLCYELGLLGVLYFIIAPVYLYYKYSNRISNLDTKLGSILLLIAFFSALFHHTLYHMQTWLVIGIAWGAYTRCCRGNAIGRGE